MKNEKPENNKSESEEEREEDKQEESVCRVQNKFNLYVFPTGLSRMNNYRQVLY